MLCMITTPDADFSPHAASSEATPVLLKTIIKEGVVKKQQVEKNGQNGLRIPTVLVSKPTWTQRTLCLEEDVLRWKVNRWICLDEVESIEEIEIDEPWSFKVVTHNQTLVIQAPSYSDKDEWLVALSKQIHLRSENRLEDLRRSRSSRRHSGAPSIGDEHRAYKRLVKTNAILQRMTTRNLE